ncbi:MULTISPECIES: FAD-dependent oxidoreductase [unclassified Oceanispirochaeta]|uniref:FAD-dependent oxidoreductase n=1 Tax=unclassified Oceanispirochaeta TaxID=2635722 RepID=UPI000E08CE2F|nr:MULTISPECIES: FAD-dependent oxidoreductase [unclassified Oceanispirochaeta]MBF9015589.1 FAD-dependent oxidoreductase [Oceanispirochaeta sp. M2]NPD73922.1 FAD-dependent oxidoreductase [Oceanispirochaeta sp. M1]RDG30234.1 thioredoxin-disulfide reductase [Oceanispirochaeta sp. M1]
MAGKIKEINAVDWDRDVLKGGKVVVDFYSTECPPCEALASKYAALSELYGNDLKFLKIFRQGNRELSQDLEVVSSPTVIFYEDGKEMADRQTGGIKRSSLVETLDKMVGDKRAVEIKNSIEPFTSEYDVAVMGGGPAGLTAATYLGQAHLKTVIIDTALTGGYVATTHQVSNYPGFIEPQQGMMLAHFMSEQTKGAGVDFRAAVDVTSIDLNKKEILIDGVETIKAKKVIIATGSSPRPLGLPGELEYRGNGISYCATCDAKYFDDKDVVVIGGGNSAIEESLFIARFAKSITIVHQFDELQANKEAQKEVFANEKINILFEHEPREFVRNGAMDMSVVVEDLKTKEMKTLNTNGIFVFVGFLPNLDGFTADLKKDDWGYLISDEDMKTNIPDIYVAGDVRTKKFRQITTAVSDGTIAAISISRELG